MNKRFNGNPFGFGFATRNPFEFGSSIKSLFELGISINLFFILIFPIALADSKTIFKNMYDDQVPRGEQELSYIQL